MEESPSRLQLRLVGAVYTAVAAASALLVFWRYLQYTRNPQDVVASGGMWAAGDLMLELFICVLFLVPTAVLVFVIRKSESASTAYAKVMLGLSITAPASIGLLFVPVLNQWYWGAAIIFRLFALPIVLIFLIFSLWLSRFARARRLISYALLIEGLTLAGVIGAFFFSSKGHHG